jgi:hypothetical protein
VSSESQLLADREHPVQHAGLLENLRRTWLERGGAGLMMQVLFALHDLGGHAVPREFDGGEQSRRASPMTTTAASAESPMREAVPGRRRL